MGENFEKIKKKTLLKAVIKCAVCGVSFGLFAVGATLLALKLIGIPLAFYFYIAIGVGAAALVGGLTFLIFKPNEKKLAKQLDEKYGLGEKLQTALVFQSEQGAVIEMQRQDADERLASLPKQGFNLAKALPDIWQFILIAVLALSIALAAFIIPANYAQGSEDSGGGGGVQQEIPFVMRDEYLDGLEELIENVKASDLDNNLKASIVTLLKRFENNLFIADYVSDVNSLLNSTISNIDKLITNAYSYVQIATALAHYDQYDFAKVIAESVRIYRTLRFVEYSEVEEYAQTCSDKIYEIIAKELNPVFEELKDKENVGNTPALIFTAISASKVSSSDNLYQLFFTLARGLASEDGLSSGTKVQFEFNLADELARQSYMRVMRLYIFNVLTALFDLPAPTDPDFMPEEPSGDDDEDDDNKTNQGGYGTGDWKNNAQVYDPRTGQYGNYMDILEDYFALVDEMLRSPDLTEEQQKIIDAYFQILFSGNTAEK